MTTSLAQQLRSLSLPQVTSQFSSDRQRVSILFDEKEAANLDKATLHDIGVTGLTALTGVDPGFEKFHALLFSDATVDFNRRIQTRETNTSLDTSIESFLFRVSPYLLLRPAQKALEWLLFRFQIHVFNVDALVTAFLPFHETTVFVRVIQCLDLTSDGSKLDRWKWLAPLQKPGVPLPRQTLYKKLISDLSFLNSFCGIPGKALAAFADDEEDDDEEDDDENMERETKKKNKYSSSAPLRPFFSCYAASLIGALESVDDVTNKEIGVLLKFVVEGLKSQSDDYRLATFMIVSALFSKKPFAKVIVVELVKCVANNLTDATLEEGVSCLAVVCHTQEDLQSQPLPAEVLQALWLRSDFLPTLVRLQQSLNVTKIVECVALRVTKNAVDSTDESMLLTLLRSDVELTPPIRIAMTREIFASFKRLKEDKRASKKPQMAKVLSILQRKFPQEVEAATKELSADDATALQLIAAANAAGTQGSELDSILLSCENPESIHRLAGVQSLVRFIEDNRDSTAPSASSSSTSLDILADAKSTDEDVVREQRLRVGDAVVKRLRHDDDVNVVTIIVQSDVVMRRYASPEDMLSLLSRSAEAAVCLSRDECGLWSHLEETLVERLAYLHYDEEAKDEETKFTQTLIFASLLPRFLRKMNDFSRSNFAQSHPLLRKFSACPRVPSNKHKTIMKRNQALSNSIVEDILSEKTAEAQSAKIGLLLSAADVNQPQRRIVGLVSVVILTKVLVNEGFIVNDGNAKSALALRLLRLLTKFDRRNIVEEVLTFDSIVTFTFTDYEEFCRALMTAGAKEAIDDFVNRKGNASSFNDIRSTRDTVSFQFCSMLLRFLFCTSKIVPKEDESPRPYKALLHHFLLSQAFFPSTAEAVGFLSLFWLPQKLFDNKDGRHDDAVVNPLHQLEALNIAAALFHSLTFSELESLLCPPSTVVPLLLSTLLSSPHLSIRSAATNCFHALLFALKTFANVSTPFQALMESIVECSDAVVVDPRQQLTRLIAENGKKDPTTLQCHVDYAVNESTDIVLRERLIELIEMAPSVDMYQSLLPAVDNLVSLLRDSSTPSSTLSTISSCLVKLLHHFVDGQVATHLTPEAPALASLMKAMDLTDAVDLISPRFVAKLPIDSKKLIFSHLFKIICVGDAADVGTDGQREQTPEQETSTKRNSQRARGVLDLISFDASIIAAEVTKSLPLKDASASASSTIKETKRRKTEEASSTKMNAEAKKAMHRQVDKMTDYIRTSLKRIGHPELLVPSLLNIVEYCLLTENESGDDVQRSAFTRDLCLATVSSILVKLRAKDRAALEGLIPSKINVELIVQCIRSPNATRQSNRNALSIVNVAAEVAPKAVLPNVISIFTFVGEHLLRRDDEFSLQILEQTLDAIVPVLVAECEEEKGEDRGMEVDEGAAGTNNDGVPDALSALRVNENVGHALRVFVEASPHIPAHRKMTIFRHLMTRLQNQNVLWCLIVIAVEAQVLPTSSAAASLPEDSFVDSIRQRHRQDAVSKSETQKLNESFHFWIDLCLDFGVEAVVVAVQRLVFFISAFPEHLVSSASASSSSSTSSSKNPFSFLDLRRLSPRQIRQLLYYSSSFANQLLAACVAHPKFLEEQDALRAPIRSLVETVVNLLLIAGRRSDAVIVDGGGGGGVTGDAPAAKFWKGILSRATELLDKINSKLSEKIFLTVIAGLMSNSSMNVQRKSLDLLAGQLSHMVGKDTGTTPPVLAAKDPEAWLGLIPSLLGFLLSESEASKPTTPQVPPQTIQAALLCLKLLARIFGRSHPKSFVSVVKRVTLLLAIDFDSVVRSSIFLTLAELCCCLKAQTVPLLNRIVPLLIAVILDPPSPPSRYAHDLLLVSSLTAVGKLLETIPEFLSPHLVKILVGISSLSLAEETYVNAEGPYKTQLTQRIPKIQDSLVAKTPTRSFLPAVSNAFCSLNEKANHLAVVPLMDLFKRHLETLSKEDFNAFVNQIIQFFVDVALDFRYKSMGTLEEAKVARVESGVIDAVVAMVMRMSEPTFRPFYYRLYDWAVEETAGGGGGGGDGAKDRIITFYAVSCKIAENLKTLFGLFIGHAIKNVAEILKRNCVVKKADIDGDDDDGEGTEAPTAVVALQPVFNNASQKWKNVLLLRHVVDTLTTVFKHDKKGDVARDNFDALHLPLIDQLENQILLRDEIDDRGMDDEEAKAFENFVSVNLAPCLAAMASAINDFATWKKMTYQICLKTKSDSTRARLQAISVLEAVALAVGQEFLGLLPETAPFLAELMEDEEEEVEKRVQAFIHVLEEQLGENLQKYFT